jgi:hypothetical protein
MIYYYHPRLKTIKKSNTRHQAFKSFDNYVFGKISDCVYDSSKDYMNYIKSLEQTGIEIFQDSIDDIYDSILFCISEKQFIL